jgi:hypothetical protein
VAWSTRRHARANAAFSPTHAPPSRDDAGGALPAELQLRTRCRGFLSGSISSCAENGFITNATHQNPIAASRTAGFSFPVMKITGPATPAALRPCPSSISTSHSVDVENDTSRLLEIGVTFESLRGRKQDGFAVVLPEQPLYCPQHLRGHHRRLKRGCDLSTSRPSPTSLEDL